MSLSFRGPDLASLSPPAPLPAPPAPPPLEATEESLEEGEGSGFPICEHVCASSASGLFLASSCGVRPGRGSHRERRVNPLKSWPQGSNACPNSPRKASQLRGAILSDTPLHIHPQRFWSLGKMPDPPDLSRILPEFFQHYLDLEAIFRKCFGFHLLRPRTVPPFRHTLLDSKE